MNTSWVEFHLKSCEYKIKGWKKLVLCLLVVLLCLVGIFVGGYFKGIEEGKRSNVDKNNNEESEKSGQHGLNKNHCVNDSKCPEGFSGRPLILVSLDGFRSDYLSRKLTPAIQWLADCGVQGQMQPVFPSKTFPNHYSIVTGLYPESHGIIDNKMYDPIRNRTFKLGSKEALNPVWWQAEPLWVTAEKAHKKAATYFWPGSEVKIGGKRPSYYRTYNGKVAWDCRTETVLSWLDLPAESRPSFITLYINEPDTTGHRYGPNSKQVNDMLEKVDSFVESLLIGLNKRKLLGCVNIVVTSDHGMDEISCDRVKTFDSYINISDVKYLLDGVTARIRPQQKEGAVKQIIGELSCKNTAFDVYDKQFLPKRYHYSDNHLIDPVVLDVATGWLMLKTHPNETQKHYCSGGAHGYDNIEPSMSALFVAHGPDLKRNVIARPFLNIELYNLLADLLNIAAQPNNGTKGSLHYLMKSPSSLKEPKMTPPPLCSVNSANFDELKQLSGCSGAEKITLNNYEDNRHIPWGAIVDTSEYDNASLCLLYNDDYASVFDYQLKLPKWTAFTLEAKTWIRNGNGNWNIDTRIPQQYAPTCHNYKKLSSQIIQESLFSSELASSSATVPMTKLMTNSVPMFKNYSMKVNKHFQELLLKWTSKYQSVNVIAGPAFDVKGNGIKQSTAEILNSQKLALPLPTHYFFVITRCSEQTSIDACSPHNLNAMAFLLPHLMEHKACQENEEFLMKHRARVKDVELLTGLRFFPSLPVYEAIRLCTEISSQLWEIGNI